jgi:hypothetical protein
MMTLADLMDRLELLRGTRRDSSRGRRSSVSGSRPPLDIDLVDAVADCEQWIAHLTWDLSVDAETDGFRVRCPHPLTGGHGQRHLHPLTGELWGNCLLIPSNLLRYIARGWIGYYGSDADLYACERYDVDRLLVACRLMLDGPATRRVWLPSDLRCPVLEPCGHRLWAELDDTGQIGTVIRCASGVESHSRPPAEWPHLAAVLRQQTAESAALERQAAAIAVPSDWNN